MRRTIITLLTLVAFATTLSAQKAATWEGILADKMCGSKWTGEKGAERAEKHTKACALEEACAASGYGLFTGGTFVKFTDASDAMAKTYLESKAPERAIRVKVTGTKDGDKIAVTSIEPMKGAAKKSAPKKNVSGSHGGSSEAGCDCCGGAKSAKHGESGHTCDGACMKN